MGFLILGSGVQISPESPIFKEEKMIKKFAIVMMSVMMFSGAADAKNRKHHKKHYRNYNQEETLFGSFDRAISRTGKMIGDMSKPSRWCGWWMRTQFGGGPEYNLARNWARRGSPSHAQVGAVVVWPHHVGVITGRASNGQFIVKSGNDSNRVRERPRSVAGAIAFRML